MLLVDRGGKAAAFSRADGMPAGGGKGAAPTGKRRGTSRTLLVVAVVGLAAACLFLAWTWTSAMSVSGGRIGASASSGSGDRRNELYSFLRSTTATATTTTSGKGKGKLSIDLGARPARKVAPMAAPVPVTPPHVPHVDNGSGEEKALRKAAQDAASAAAAAVTGAEADGGGGGGGEEEEGDDDDDDDEEGEGEATADAGKKEEEEGAAAASSGAGDGAASAASASASEDTEEKEEKEEKKEEEEEGEGEGKGDEAGPDTVPASIAHFLTSGKWRVGREYPSRPHVPLFPRLFGGGGDGDAVPEPGCEAKWGFSWLRDLAKSRTDACVPSKAKAAEVGAEGDALYRPRNGGEVLAWEEETASGMYGLNASGRRVRSKRTAPAADGGRTKLEHSQTQTQTQQQQWSGGTDEQYGVRMGETQGGGRGSGPRTAPSRITRWTSPTGSHFEWMRNVAVDFGRKTTPGNDHNFAHGFIQAACDVRSSLTDMDQGRQPAFTALETVPSGDGVACDSWIHTPTLVVQHEDIGNTYHNLADFWRAWVSLHLLSAPMCVPSEEADPTKDATRAHGPSGALREAAFDDARFDPPPTNAAAAAQAQCAPGETAVPGLDPDHLQVMTLDARLMCGTIDIAGVPITAENREDCLGPYFPQYNTWGGQGVVRGRDFGSQRVCFSAVGFATNTPESHIWDKFHETNPCSTSPALRTYSTYTAERWGLAHGGPRAFRTDRCRMESAAKAKVSGATVQAPSPPRKGAPFSFNLPQWVFEEPGPHEERIRGVTRIPPNLSGVTTGPGQTGLGGSGSEAPGSGMMSQCGRPYARVVYVARKTKPFSANPVQDRVVGNEALMFMALQYGASVAGFDLDIVEADFAKMAYRDQVALTRSASLLVGMHGAGLVHGLDLADADECGGGTGVLELFPLGHTEKGIRNMVVQVGRRYWSWTNTDPAGETGAGTVVDTTAVTEIIVDVLKTLIADRAACKFRAGSV